MPREGAITFRDIAGKLTVLRVTCDKCGRSASYRVDRLSMRYGIDAKLFDWSEESRPTARVGIPETSTTSAARNALICRKLCNVLGTLR